MTHMSSTEKPARSSFGEAFLVWLKIGCINFGGPAGQIALMHRVVVDEKKWVDEPRFLHALNFCMLLPGPEAQKLATYLGWLMHGVRGGLGRRNSVRAARRIRDVGPEPDVCTRAGNFGGRRRAVRHQGGGSGDCDRGADPHRQARAQDTAFALAGGGCLRRHLLSGAAFPVDCRSCCRHRLLRRA